MIKFSKIVKIISVPISMDQYKAVVFCKVGLRTRRPEISENPKKNKNEIRVFFQSRRPERKRRMLLISLPVYSHLNIRNIAGANPIKLDILCCVPYYKHLYYYTF